MENATKALLIAGSVLVAILLIAMGLRIFNSTQGTVDSSQKTMDATAIATFNTQFTGYLNKSLTVSQATMLAQKIMASNAVNNLHKIKYGDRTDLVIPNSLSGEGTYVGLDENDDGYIDRIKLDSNPT